VEATEVLYIQYAKSLYTKIREDLSSWWLHKKPLNPWKNTQKTFWMIKAIFYYGRFKCKGLKQLNLSDKKFDIWILHIKKIYIIGEKSLIYMFSKFFEHIFIKAFSY
jgi:hypothetical protein